jgi:DNA invertase Pin-like site-specific DNA recombinase
MLSFAGDLTVSQGLLNILSQPLKSYQENIDTGSPMGKAMFTIVSAIAELEADIIKERILAGLSNARAKGVILGRPAPEFDKDELIRLRNSGLSIRAIAERTNLKKSFVHKTLQNTTR